MPPSATSEDIKAYQAKLKRMKSRPGTCRRVRCVGLNPDFSRCTPIATDFLVVVEMIVKTVLRADSVQMPRRRQDLYLLSGFRPAVQAIYPADDHGVSANPVVPEHSGYQKAVVVQQKQAAAGLSGRTKESRALHGLSFGD